MNEFLLSGEIEESNSAKAIAWLAENEGDVVLNIDSIGGDVFAGLRLCQAIANHKGKVTAKCGVVVASIASVIALACDEVQITKDTFFMVHQAWAVASGTAEELMSTATLLEQASSRIKEIIASKAVNADDADEWMKKDTWMGYQNVLDSFTGVSLVDEERKLDAGVVASYAKLKNKPEALMALVAKLQAEEEKPPAGDPEKEEPADECEEPKDEADEPEAPDDDEAEKEEQAKAQAMAKIEAILARADAILKG